MNGGCAEQGQDHEDQDQSAIATHDGLIFVGQVAGKDASQDFFAVEGKNGNKVKDGQGNVDDNKQVRNWGQGGWYRKEAGGKADENRGENVGSRAGNGDQGGVAAGVA